MRAHSLRGACLSLAPNAIKAVMQFVNMRNWADAPSATTVGDLHAPTAAYRPPHTFVGGEEYWDHMAKETAHTPPNPSQRQPESVRAP